MNCREVPEDAAPITASTPAFSRRGISVSYALLSVSPESPKVASMVMPLAASLMSLIASATPASSGGPRKARFPVRGRAVPSFRTRSPSCSAPSSQPPGVVVAAALVSDSVASVSVVVAAQPAKAAALSAKTPRAETVLRAKRDLMSISVILAP